MTYVPKKLMVTANQIANIERSVREGLTRERACTLHGLSVTDWRRIKRESATVAVYAKFIAVLDAAEADVEGKLVKKLLESKDWRAAARMLQARYPDEWADKVQVEVKREIDHVLDVAENVLEPEHFERFLSALGRSSPGETRPPEGPSQVVH